MKKNIPRRRRLDVDVEELDRIIDDAKTAPLSEADSQKLKTALHALAENLLPQRNTEKTSSVFGDAEKAAWQDMPAEADQPSGHGRNGAAAYRGAEKVRHHACQAGSRRSLPGLRPRQRLRAKGAQGAGADRGAGAAGRYRV